jgi:hypothetical protein
MKVSEIIRSILDVIDKVEASQTLNRSAEQIPNDKLYNDDVRRFQQIVDLADSGEPTEYSNTPREEYAALDSVTDSAGGGWMEPKHQDDIRGDSFRIHGRN